MTLGQRKGLFKLERLLTLAAANAALRCNHDTNDLANLPEVNIDDISACLEFIDTKGISGLELQVFNQALKWVASQHGKQESEFKRAHIVYTANELARNTDPMYPPHYVELSESAQTFLDFFNTENNWFELKLRFVPFIEKHFTSQMGMRFFYDYSRMFTGDQTDEERRTFPSRETNQGSTNGAKRKTDKVKAKPDPNLVPVDEVPAKQPGNVHSYATVLKQHIVGQSEAIEQIDFRLQQTAIYPKPNQPAATFFFVGAGGVGKGTAARLLPEALKCDYSLFELDMAPMNLRNQGSVIDGMETSFHNSAPGLLTSHVRENPKSVVLLNNIDSAHPAIIAKLSTIFSSGKLRDQFGFYQDNDPEKEQIAPAEVDFSQVILVLTTTSLADILYSDSFNKIRSNKESAKNTLYQQLAKLKSPLTNELVFPRQVLDGLESDDIVCFDRLTMPEYLELAQRSVDELTRTLGERKGITLHTEKKVNEILLLSLSPDINAGKVRAAAERMLLKPVIAQLSKGASFDTCKVKVSADFAKSLDEFVVAGGTDITRWLFRNNWVVGYELSTMVKANCLHVTIKGFKPTKSVKTEDLGEQGSIQVEVPSITFADIVGHNCVKLRLQQVTSLLKNAQPLLQHNVSVPKGVLLYGPPGTGKTMLAKALANEADLPFISVSGTDFLDHEYIKLVFERIRRYAPAILFIDEIDVLGSREGKGHTVAINQLLTEIDGFSTALSEPVFVIAATNRPNDLDSALVRSGRIDIHVEIPNLDREARKFFIDKYLELPHDGSLDVDNLLTLTSGMSGADLEKARREAVLEMFRLKKDKINQEMLEEIINQNKYGHRTTAQRSLEDSVMVALHEAGHAVASKALNPEKHIELISISARGGHGGFVSINTDSAESKRYTRQEVLEEMAVLLAGRVAELKKRGREEICAGAASDIARATALAVEAISEYGLDPELGFISTAKLDDRHKSALAGEVMQRVKVWLADAEALSTDTLTKNWDVVENIVLKLLKNDVINGTELDNLDIVRP